MSKFFTTEISKIADLDLITVKSNALKKRADITVYNPCDVNDVNIPLVILLHGVYGSHWAWSLKGKVNKTAKRLISEAKIPKMILAMPSDGLYADGSAYLPHKNENYEDWIARDVIQVLKENYVQISENSPVFIAGLSMGGYGALRLGAKYPEIFTSFSGLSSITEFNQIAQFVSDFHDLEKDVIIQDSVIETILRNKEKLRKFRFDCGSNDTLIEPNRILHIELKENNLEHIYEELPGEHSWDYWEENISKTLIFFGEFC